MSTPMFHTGRRKISLPFGDFTPTVGRGISLGAILCLAAQFLRWGTLLIVLGGQPSALLALLTAGNCRNPYLDTVENGSTLGKSDIHDTQFDAKAPRPTPKNRKIDALQNSRSGRLCRPL